MFNNATRKKAAKYVVNNNMSMSEAKKKANKAAVRNTALMMAAYGAVTVGSIAVGKYTSRPKAQVLDAAGNVLKNYRM